MARRLTFRGSYAARLYSGVLVAVGGGMALTFVGMGVLLSLEMLKGTLTAVPFLAIAGLLHARRPRTVVDLDARQVQWANNALRFDELRGVAFTSSLVTIRGKGGPHTVLVYDATLLPVKPQVEQRELLASSHPEAAWELSRRLARTLGVAWLTVGADSVREVKPEALDQPMTIQPSAKLSAPPDGVLLERVGAQTHVHLPGVQRSVLLAAGALALGLCGSAWLAIPAWASVPRFIVLGIGLAAIGGIASIPWLRVRTVVFDSAAMRLLRPRGEYATVRWGDLRALQVNPLGTSVLVGAGDRLLQVRTPHAKWLCDAMAARGGTRR